MTNCNEIPQTAYERVYGSGINSEEKYDVRLEKIIDFFGSENQSKLAMEECAELIQAISKMLRYGSTLETESALIEGIADVEIMIEQLKLIYFVHEEHIRNAKEEKIERTLNRMERALKN